MEKSAPQNTRIATDLGELIIRPFDSGDVTFHGDYLYHSSDTFLQGIGFDTAKFATRSEWEAATKTRIALLKESGNPPAVMAAEYQYRTISMMFLDRRNPDGQPRLHFHIFDPELRGKGLGSIIFMQCLKALSQMHAIQKFLIEPKADNQPMNRLMRKLGFRHVQDYILAAGPVTQEMLVSQYEVKV